MVALAADERILLRWVARRTEGKVSRWGKDWVRYAVPHDADGARWEWDTYRPLVERGLLERGEDWKDVFVRLTDEGWKALASGN